MCAIVGIVATSYVNQELYDALITLQHRGQDAAGIATCLHKQLFLHKGNGFVRDVFDTQNMLHLKGNMGIGHVRYPTAGSSSKDEAQPFYVNSPYGICLAHNGNLTNADELKQDLEIHDLRHVNTTSDSEVLLNIFAHELQALRKTNISHQEIFQAVAAVHKRCQGAYAVVAMITGYGIVGFRDPHGIRPIIYGKRETPQGTEYMLASESVALDTLGFSIIADIAPGEAVVITEAGELYHQQCAEKTTYTPCIFEHVYLARPDSIIDKISVYKVRLQLGKYLAEKILKERPDHDIDVVVPVPETSRTAGATLAKHLGVEFREGFVKNIYIGRTFIMPGQQLRSKSVRQKLNAIHLEFNNKNVLLVDDSIVRGTTSKEIIKMAREAGAKKVYFASAAPMIRFPNVYGIDMPAANELVAHEKNLEQICQAIGADWLIYQDLDKLVAAAQKGNPDIQRFEDSVFTGDYITGAISADYLSQVAQKRNDKAKNCLETINNNLSI